MSSALDKVSVKFTWKLIVLIAVFLAVCIVLQALTPIQAADTLLWIFWAMFQVLKGLAVLIKTMIARRHNFDW